uniref:Putative secreted protein n=1 Tax=Amblyomma cajennense TaxID=34607 RepID=A0A023FE66_AMBCJ
MLRSVHLVSLLGLCLVLETLGTIERQCDSWNATVIVNVSSVQRTVHASVKVFKDSPPGCDRLRVSLWDVWGGAASPCTGMNIMRTGHETEGNLVNSSMSVLFENVTNGNYCVRVKPVCDPDCLTLFSNVVELSEAAEVVERKKTGKKKARRPEA